MALRIKILVLVSFLLLLSIPLVSSARVLEGFKKENNPILSIQEDGKHMINWRKLLIMPEAVLDYDEAEPNPRHDQRRKRSNP